MFITCSVTCLLVDGKRGKVTNAVKLHVGFLSFSWNHELKVLNEGHFQGILGHVFRNAPKCGLIYFVEHIPLIFPRIVPHHYHGVRPMGGKNRTYNVHVRKRRIWPLFCRYIQRFESECYNGQIFCIVFLLS